MPNEQSVYLKIFLLLILLFSPLISRAHEFQKTSPKGISLSTSSSCAIVLHGLARSPGSMSTMARRLKNSGYQVWNKGYPSTEKRIEELALVIDDAIRFCKTKGAEDLYFVTHSMGGILVRQYFQTHSTQNVKAIVMLAPPNHGSEIVDAYRDTWWFSWYHGPAGLQLGTESGSFVRQLAALDAPIGIIAGTESSDPWFGHLFHGPYDGKVSVESAQLAEMRDFITVPRGHTRIMNAPEVLMQTLFFFEYLQFNK